MGPGLTVGYKFRVAGYPWPAFLASIAVLSRQGRLKLSSFHSVGYKVSSAPDLVSRYAWQLLPKGRTNSSGLSFFHNRWCASVTVNIIIAIAGLVKQAYVDIIYPHLTK